MSARHYLNRARLDALRTRLSGRDRDLLHAVARLGVASGAQLQRLFYGSTDSASRLARGDLARLTDWRILARLDRRIGGVRAGSAGFVYALGVAGQRLAYPGRARYRPPWTPGRLHLAHALAVSELYVDLRHLERSGAVRLQVFDTEPVCWRTYAGPGGGRLVVKPDAFIVVEAGDFEDHLFIEVDRATESLTRITTKTKAYTQYWQSGREQASTGIFPRVLWVVPDAHRQTQITAALARLPAEHWQLFAVTTAADVAGWLAGTTTSTNDREEATS